MVDNDDDDSKLVVVSETISTVTLYVGVDDVGSCDKSTVVTADAVNDGDDARAVDPNAVVIAEINSGVVVVVDIESVSSELVATVNCGNEVTNVVATLVDAAVGLEVVILAIVDTVAAVDFVVVFVVVAVGNFVVVVDFGVVIVDVVARGFVVVGVVAIFDVVIDCAELVDIRLNGHKRLVGGSHVQLPPFCRQFGELAMSYCVKRINHPPNISLGNVFARTKQFPPSVSLPNGDYKDSIHIYSTTYSIVDRCESNETKW